MKGGTNPFEDSGNEENPPVLYPKHKDPFVKRTKSVKKMRKYEKKVKKKEKHQAKKQEKYQKKMQKHAAKTKTKDPNGKVIHTNGTDSVIEKKNGPEPDDNMNERSNHRSERLTSSSATLPPARSPEEKPKEPEKSGYQTMDCRSPTEKEPPILPNKRILELRAAGGAGAPRLTLTPDSTSKKQTFIPSQSMSSKDSSTPAERPNTLELSNKTQTLTVPPEGYNRQSPLIDAHQGGDDILRVRRTGSVSKVQKEKSKKKKKLKKLMKKKKKSKGGQKLDVLEEQETMNQVNMRRKVNQIETIERQISETQDILRSNVENLVNQRNSHLDTLLQASEKLDEASYGFAQVAKENRLRQQAKTSCCGLGSKYKICWYICACETGVKKKKTKTSQRSAGSPESLGLLSPREAADLKGDTEDDCYKPADSSAKTKTKKKTPSPKEERPVSTSYNENDNRFSGTMQSLTSRFSQLPAALRGSMPSLTKKESPTLRKSESGNGTLLPRRPSSVSSVQDVIKKVSNKKTREKERKEREKREKSLRTYVDAHFENEEARGRAISLLRMDGSEIDE